MCDLIEKLFMDIKPELLNIQIDAKDVMEHYEKDKDELIVMIGKLKAENYSLHQRLIGLDMFLKEICGETIKEMQEKEDEKINKINSELKLDCSVYCDNITCDVFE
jgi:hypothetical protein